MAFDSEFAWAPQPGPQHAFVTCPVFEVVYGGARGGGKTDACLGDWALHQESYGKDAKGLFLRRSGKALGPTIGRAKEILKPIGGDWREGKGQFEMPAGGSLSFRHLENLDDADLYQGHDYTRVYIEELTQFPTSAPIDKLKGVLRSGAGVPCGMRSSCNPGGPGHLWVKQRYIDPGPFKVVREKYLNPFTKETQTLSRCFIPAKLTDNPKLLNNDPGYVPRLMQTGSAALVKAWLEGDWNIVDGAFFDQWSNRNIVKPFPIPEGWIKFRSFDEGYAKPFSTGWWAIATDPYDAGHVRIPRGCLVRYREWYGSNGKPNEGLRLTAEAIAAGIKQRDGADKIAYGVADDSIFKQAGGPSVHERMAKITGGWRPADKTRVGRNGAFGGWDQMRSRIAGTDEGPMLVVFSTCKDFIRTVPVLQHDKDYAEDLDSESEDHVADECRYACMSRPMPAGHPTKVTKPPDLDRWRGIAAGADSWKTA